MAAVQEVKISVKELEVSAAIETARIIVRAFAGAPMTPSERRLYDISIATLSKQLADAADSALTNTPHSA